MADHTRRRADHLLLAADAGPEEIVTLAQARFPLLRPVSEGVWRLSAHSTLILPAEGTVDAGGGADGAGGGPMGAWPQPIDGVPVVARVSAPMERVAYPDLPGGDKDGLRAAFGSAEPVRDEARSVSWLVAAARRLRGGVGIDVDPGGPRTYLWPRPEAAPGLTVATDVWLTAPALSAVLTTAGLHVVPGPQGPPPSKVVAPGATKARRDGYGVLLGIGPIGQHAEAGGETEATYVGVSAGILERPPAALSAVTWLQDGGIAYSVVVYPGDVAAAGQYEPAPRVADELRAAAQVAERAARALWDVVGGFVVDEDGFVVDPGDLLAGGPE